MKKLLFVLLLALIPACEIVDFVSDIDEVYETVEEQYWDGKYIGKIENYNFPGSETIPEFETIEDAANWMKNNIIYKYDKELFGKDDYWQTPEEFYFNRNVDNKMQGDCEDFALFFGFLANKLNLNTNIYNIKRKNMHAIAKVENWYYEFSAYYFNKYAQLYNVDKVINIIPYSEALWMAVNYHDNVGKYR